MGKSPKKFPRSRAKSPRLMDLPTRILTPSRSPSVYAEAMASEYHAPAFTPSGSSAESLMDLPVAR